MPLQWKNLSESVIKDSKGVEKSLEGLIKTTGKADKSFSKLSATQQSALNISKKFKVAVDSLSKGMGKLKTVGTSALNSFGGISRVSTTAATSVDSLSASFKDIGKTTKIASAKIGGLAKSINSIEDKEIHIGLDIAGEKQVKKLVDNLKKQLKVEVPIEKLEKKRYKAVDKLEWVENHRTKAIKKSTVEEKKRAAVIKKSGLDKLLKKQIGTAEHLLKGLEIKFEDIADKQPVIDLKVKIAKMNEFAELVEWLEEDEKAAIEARLATEDLDKVINDTAASNEDFALRIHKSADALEEESESAKKLHGELSKADSLTDIFTNRLAEGGREAKNFADGIGVSNGALMGAGVAMVYLAGKASEVIGGFTSSRMSLAKYRQETLLSAKETLGFSKGALEGLRKSLSLTREQAKEYFKVVHQGANQLGMAPSAIREVSEALQDTFGGDPTERLREYVDLLKDIPTLDTDLKVTASLDDQSAAIFDLAQKGKMETVIDLQAAGILGGTKAIEFDTKDKTVIQAQQKTENRVQAINDTMMKYYPDWGPQFTAITDYMFKTFGAIGGGIAVLGAMKAFAMTSAAKTIGGISKVDTSVLAVKASVDALGMKMGVKGRGPGVLGRNAKGQFVRPGDKSAGDFMTRVTPAARLPGRNARGQFVKPGDKAAGDFMTRIPKGPPPLPKGAAGVGNELVALESTVAKTSSGIANSTKAISASTKGLAGGLRMVGKVGLGVGIALEAAGIAADILSDNLQESGHDIASAGTKAGSSLLKIGAAAATGATIGAALGAIGGPLAFLTAGIGAAVGAALGFVVNLDDLGSSMEKWGEGLSTRKKKVGGTEVSEFGPTLRALGIAAEFVGGGLSEMGSQVAAAGKALWKATKFVTYWGSGLGTTIEAFKALDKALDPKRAKAFEEAGKSAAVLNKKMQELSEASKDFEKSSEEYIRGVMISGLALQKEMSLLKKTFESGKFALVDFQASLAQVDIGALSEVGGSAESFGIAVDAAAAAVSTRFTMTTETLDKSRKRIAEDSKLQGEQRRQALDLLHKQEMEAVKQFVEGMRKTVEALYKSPQIIQSGLKREISKVPVDLGLEIGSLKAEDLFKGFDSQMKNLQDLQQEYGKAGKKAEEELGEVRLKLAEAGKKALESMSEEQKKALANKGVLKATKDGYEFQKEAAVGYFKEVEKSISIQEQKMDELKKSFEIGEVDKLVLSLSKVDARSAQAAKGLEAAQDKASKLDAKADNDKYISALNSVKAAKEEVKAAEEAKQEVTLKMEEMSDNIAKELKLKPEDIKKSFGMVAETMKKGKMLEAGDVSGGKEEVEKTLAVQDAIIKKMKDGGKNFEKMAPLLQKYSKSLDTRDQLKEMMMGIDGETTILETRLDIIKKNVEVQKQIAETTTQMTRIAETDEVRNAERQLRALQDVAAEAGMMGDPTSAVVGALEQQTELFSQQMEQSKKSIDNLKKAAKAQAQNLVQAEKEEKDAVAQVRAEDEASKKKAEEAKKTADMARNTLRTTQNALENLEKQRTEFARSFPKIGAGVAQTMEEFRDSFSGQQIAAQIDLSDALMEFTEFGDDFAAISKEARDIGIKAAHDRLKTDKESIRKGMAAERKAIEERAKQAEALPGGAGEGERIRNEGKITLQAKERLLMAKAETESKKRVADLAEKEASFKVGLIDATQSALDSEIEVAAMRGHHLSAVISKQNEMIGLERQRVEVVREQYEISKAENADSQKTQMLGLQLRKAEADLQKKSLGYQRDIMEKMIGSALAGIRTSVGARRQRGTDVALMGIEATRVKTRVGAYTEAGPGGVKPYHQRLAEYQAAGKGGGASRMAPEKAMAKGIIDSGLSKDTEKLKKDMHTVKEDGHSPGSLYTHDTTAEGILASILYVTEEIAVGILEGNKNAIGGGVGVRGNLDAGINNIKEMVNKLAGIKNIEQAAAKKTEEVAENTKGTAEGQREVASSADASVTKEETSNKIQKRQEKMQKQELALNKKGVRTDKSFHQKSEKQMGDVSSKLSGPNINLGGPSGKLGGPDMKLGGGPTTLGTPFGKQLGGDKIGLQPGGDSTYKKNLAIYQEKRAKKQEGMATTQPSVDKDHIKNLKDATDYAMSHAKQASGNSKEFNDWLTGADKKQERYAKNQENAIYDSQSTGVSEVKSMTGDETMAIAQRSRAMTPIGGAAGQAAFAPVGGVKGALSATGEAATGGGGGGGGTADAATMKVEGKMTVHFDNAAFKDQIATVVGSVIKTPYISKSIQSVVLN